MVKRNRHNENSGDNLSNNSLVTSLAPFNKKQVAYINATLDSWLNVAEGGKRAGKNVINIISWCMCIEEHPAKLHLASGYSKASAQMNIIDCNGYGVMAYFAGRVQKGTYNNMDAYYIQTKKGEKVVVIAGGGNKDSYKSIKGNSYGTAYITEVNECHQTFLDEVQLRTAASPKKQLFFDLNPKPPNNWFYKDFLDVQIEKQKKNKNYGFNYGHFTIFDNMSIPNLRLKQELDRYDRDSLLYKTDIKGIRAVSTGRIYSSFDSREVYITEEELQTRTFCAFSIGIDVGGSDATVATLLGYTSAYKECILLDGYYHKQGKIANVMDHSVYIKNICDTIEDWVLKYGGLFDCPIFCESADKLFRAGLQKEFNRRRLRFTVTPSYKKDGILARIRLNSAIITQSRFKVVKRARLSPWVEAYENGAWDEKAFNDGEFVRLDDGSYPVDCLDSTEYAMYPFKDKLL